MAHQRCIVKGCSDNGTVFQLQDFAAESCYVPSPTTRIFGMAIASLTPSSMNTPTRVALTPSTPPPIAASTTQQDVVPTQLNFGDVLEGTPGASPPPMRSASQHDADDVMVRPQNARPDLTHHNTDDTDDATVAGRKRRRVQRVKAATPASVAQQTPMPLPPIRRPAREPEFLAEVVSTFARCNTRATTITWPQATEPSPLAEHRVVLPRISDLPHKAHASWQEAMTTILEAAEERSERNDQSGTTRSPSLRSDNARRAIKPYERCLSSSRISTSVSSSRSISSATSFVRSRR